MKTDTLLAALAAVLIASPAAAKPMTYARTVTYADLNLQRAHDMAIFDRRLRTAIQQVCGTTADFDVPGRNSIAKCRAGLTASIAAQRDKAIASSHRSGTALASRQ